ncbi:hypothetical protein JR316_0001925 [Psilocybe cubensis]|uniref:Uncharacterized protein n=2 Tax=Psilocybe cubensis TaxID=181762 RepID=A0A8H7Y2C6_PSICU|nr:hypothetical protein JR316_0001925 [Psilocybe cubensis]KAH9485021.1 hypothetical protein JR316_0001925 [Psilocybe cubensis]
MLTLSLAATGGQRADKESSGTFIPTGEDVRKEVDDFCPFPKRVMRLSSTWPRFDRDSLFIHSPQLPAIQAAPQDSSSTQYLFPRHISTSQYLSTTTTTQCSTPDTHYTHPLHLRTQSSPMYDYPHPATPDIDTSWKSRWAYSVSDARSEPIPIERPARQIPPPSLPSPPPQSTPPPLTEIEPGVWIKDGNTLYASNWPPVQQYLNEVREQRYLVDPPSEIIFALAALDVLKTPSDSAHWIFFSDARRRETLHNVNKIALHQPRLIKPSFPWLGIAEMKHTLVPAQLKFEYTFIRRQWYPIEGVVVETKKRALRSSGDVPEVQTPEEYFNLLKPEEIPRKKSAKRNANAKAKPKTTASPVAGPSAPSAPVAGPSAIPAPVEEQPSPTTSLTEEVLPVAEQITDASAYVSPPRSSTRARRKVTPTSRSPRTLSMPTEKSSSVITASPVEESATPIPSPTLTMTSSSSTHSRSASQSSMKTLVDSKRSVSVLSSDTVVETSSRKRKSEDDLEKVVEEVEQEQEECASTGTERMVTRGRTSKKVRTVDIEKDSASASPTNSPPLEPAAKIQRRRTGAKKSGT